MTAAHNWLLNWKTDCALFLDQLFAELKTKNIDVEAFELDHVCLRVETVDEYNRAKNYFASIGLLLSDAMVNGRPISTFKLLEPLTYNDRSIFLIEIPSPKASKPYSTGFEHAEFVIDKNFKDFSSQYPGIAFDFSGARKSLNAELSLPLTPQLAVKFHQQSLERVIEIENEAPV